jgi:four helix bundle protein
MDGLFGLPPLHGWVVQPFKTLIVWQKADALSARMDVVCDGMKRRSRILSEQLREATASIPAAIAEGAGRATRKDFANFLSMAIGSCNEVENHLIRALRRNFISPEHHDALAEATIEVHRMAFGLRKRLLET